MRKYNKFLALVLCVSMALPFTGCSSAKDDGKDSSQGTSSEATSGNDKEDDKDKEYVREADIYEGLDYSSILELGDYSSIPLAKKDKKGTVKKGNTVNIYYVGKMDGEAFANGSCTKDTNPDGYNLKIGSGNFIDGFEDALIGKKAGKTYDIDVTFPESYPPNPDYAGKPAVFTVTINYIKEWPELTDKFVKDNFKDFDKDYKNTAKDYTKFIRSNVVQDLAWDYVYTKSDVKEYPEDLLERVKTQYKTPIVYYLGKNNTTLDDYLAAQSMTSEDFENNVETSAKSDLGKRLVFNAIAQKEGIGLDADAYKDVLNAYLKEYAVDDQDALDKLFDEYFGTKSEDIINNEILYTSVNEFLVGKVKETA